MINFTIYTEGKDEADTLAYENGEEMESKLEEEFMKLSGDAITGGKYSVVIQAHDDQDTCQVSYTTGGVRDLTTDASDLFYNLIERYSPDPLYTIINMTMVHSQLGALVVANEDAQAVADAIKAILSEDKNYEPAGAQA